MKPRQILPNIWGALLIVGVLWALELVIAAAFYDAGVVFEPGDPQGVLVALLANGVIFVVVMHFTGLRYRELFHPSSSSVSSTLVLLTAPVLLVIIGAVGWMGDFVALIAEVFKPDESARRMLGTLVGSGLVSVISLVVVAPFLEEMLFRGIILRGFLTHYPADAAILLSALLFGVLHLNVYQIPVAILAGCFLGWLYYGSRSLWPGIIAHSAFNLAALLFSGGRQAEPGLHLGIDAIGLTVSGIGLWLIGRVLRGQP